MALLTDLSNSFYLENKHPALSSTLYPTLMVTAALYKLSLNIVFSKRNKDLND